MEEWGSGYVRVVKACQNGGYPEPVWNELGTAMRVVFYPHSDASDSESKKVPINKRQEWFIAQLSAEKKCKAIDIAVQWKVTEKTAKRDISTLKKNGIIDYVGSRKNGFYILTKNNE